MKVVYPICCGVDVHKTFLVTFRSKLQPVPQNGHVVWTNA